MRRHGIVWAAAITLLLPYALVVEGAIDLDRPLVLVGGGFGWLLSVLVAVLPWEHLIRHPAGRRLIEAYPFGVAAIGALLAAFAPWNPVYGIVMLVSAVVGATYSRREVVWATGALSLVCLGAAAIDSSEIDRFTQLFFAVSLVSASWLSYATGSDQRRALDDFANEQAQLASRAHRLGILAEAASTIPSVTTGEAMQAVANVAPDLGWDVCAVYVPGHAGFGHDLAGQYGLPGALVRSSESRTGIFDMAFRTRDVVVLDDAAVDPRIGPRWRGAASSLLAIPIMVGEVQRGVLAVGTHHPHRATEDDVQTLRLLAGIAGRSLGVATEYERRERGIEELQRISKLKQDFLGTVSHELRTPLAVVLGMAETIDVHWDQLPDERRHDLASRLHVNAAGLERVIQALLDYSRLEAGMVEPRRRPVELLDVAIDVVQRLQVLVPDHHVLVQAGSRSRSTSAFADPILVERVIENLVTNACRHTPVGTHVRVHVRDTPEHVWVEVEDDGPGIEPEDLAHLGERFYRGGDPLTRSSKGLGLGLAFCRQVLHMHDSELRIKSEVGVGTTFSFCLAHEEDAPILLDA